MIHWKDDIEDETINGEEHINGKFSVYNGLKQKREVYNWNYGIELGHSVGSFHSVGNDSNYVNWVSNTYAEWLVFKI